MNYTKIISRSYTYFCLLGYENIARLNTVGFEDFIRAIFLFGAQTRLSLSNYEQKLQSINNKRVLMQLARQEYESIVVNPCIRRSLHKESVNITYFESLPGSDILPYREKDGWLGSDYFLIAVENFPSY